MAKTPELSPEKFAKQMRQIFHSHLFDLEKAHVDADDLMCEVLKSLGYAKGVQMFEDAKIWCA